MATYNHCESCEEIRQKNPSMVANRFTDTECAYLQNNTGIDGKSTNCEDLDAMNDCLIGSMEDEAEIADLCSWREYVLKLIPNLWTMFKAIICSMCGLWEKVSSIETVTSAPAFVRYYRDLGKSSSGGGFWWNNLSAGDSHSLDIYMDSSGTDSGTEVADRDYLVMISNCTNFQYFKELGSVVTFYSSGDERSMEDIRNSLGQHPTFRFPTSSSQNIHNFSWTTSGSVLVKKGEHVKVNFYCSSASYDGSESTGPRARLHQFALTWIPVNAIDE